MMLKLRRNVLSRASQPVKPLAALRSVRPSLLDLRFTGDPWVVDQDNGTVSVRLDDYRLAHIEAVPLDLPSFNQLWMQLRQWQMRRCFYRQRRDFAPQCDGESPHHLPNK